MGEQKPIVPKNIDRDLRRHSGRVPRRMTRSNLDSRENPSSIRGLKPGSNGPPLGPKVNDNK